MALHCRGTGLRSGTLCPSSPELQDGRRSNPVSVVNLRNRRDGEIGCVYGDHVTSRTKTNSLHVHLSLRHVSRRGELVGSHTPLLGPSICCAANIAMCTYRVRESVGAKDYSAVIHSVDASWWGGRRVSRMLPRLFFENFCDTTFVVVTDEAGGGDSGQAREELILGFLCGFISQSRAGEVRHGWPKNEKSIIMNSRARSRYPTTNCT